jgi:hypothetical protein
MHERGSSQRDGSGAKKKGAARPGVPGGRRRLLACILLATLVTGEGSAAAEMNLIWIRDVYQDVGATYHFFDNASGGGRQTISQSKHELREDYRLSSDYALLNTSICKGSAELDLLFDQQFEKDQGSRGRSSEINVGYQVSSLIFGNSPTPLSVSAGSHQTTENPSFSRSYDLQTSDLSLSLGWRNKYLPVHVSYLQNDSQTSGLENDRRQSNNTARLEMEHRDGSFSFTRLDLMRSDSRDTLFSGSQRSDEREERLNLANTLSWQDARGLSRTVNSTFTMDDNSGLYHGSSRNFTTGGSADLGKALSATANYTLLANSTGSQSLRTHAGGFSLSHRLYQSLTSTLSGAAASSSYNDGSEESYSGGGSLLYQYRYPGGTKLSLAYTFSYTLDDRKRSGEVNPADNERHAIPPHDPRLVTLAHSTFRPATVTVTGAQTLLVYASGTDYLVTAEGIEVLPGRMVGDTEVLISYSYLEDPRVTFANTGQSVSARLTRPGGQNSFYADYRSSKPSLLRGEATAVTLSPVYHAALGWQYTKRSTAQLEYGWNKNYSVDLHYLNARWALQGFFLNGTATLNANDYLSINTRAVGTSSWSNGLNVQGSYSRKLGVAVTGRVGLAYFNSVGDAGVGNTVSANMNLDGTFGKTRASLASNVLWGASSGSWTRSESVTLSFNRFF